MDIGETEVRRLQSLILRLERQKKNSALSDEGDHPITAESPTRTAALEESHGEEVFDEHVSEIEACTVQSESNVANDGVLEPVVTTDVLQTCAATDDVLEPAVSGDDSDWLVGSLSHGHRNSPTESWLRSDFDCQSYRGSGRLLSVLTEYSPVPQRKILISREPSHFEDIMALAREEEVHLKQGTNFADMSGKLLAPKSVVTASLKSIPRATDSMQPNLNHLTTSASTNSLLAKLRRSQSPNSIHEHLGLSRPPQSSTMPSTISTSNSNISHLSLPHNRSFSSMSKSAENHSIPLSSSMHPHTSKIGRPSGSLSNIPQPRSRLPMSRLVRPSVVRRDEI